MKIRYEVLSPDGLLTLASVTLYGDHDSESDHVLGWLIRESLCIVRVRNGADHVQVRRREVDT